MSTPAPKITEVHGVRRGRFRWLWFTAAGLILVLLLAAAGGLAYGRSVGLRSLPQISGELQLSGLKGPVSVYRDEWGVPHIEANSEWDLFMAQGFVTAQDRFWQMEKTRRAGAGRLSEVLGASMLDTDKFVRTFLFYRSAEKSLAALSPSARTALEAYTAGVNAYIDQAVRRNALPVEFTILGFKPEPWTPTDSAVIGKLMAYDLGGNFKGEVYRYQLRRKVGDELLKQVLPVYPSDVTIMKSTASGGPPNRVAELPSDNSKIDVSGLLNAGIFPDPFLGSNNWVLSGSLTKTGKPLLANDPHLGLSTPAIWYQTHLILNSPSEQMNVVGVMFPGAPGVVIGHNEQIAWGVTNTGPDVQDLFIEKRNPQNPHQFEFMGKWEDAAVYKETIKVKGKADVPLEIVVTRHGPIVSEVVGSKEDRPGEALALKWTAHMPTTELEAVIGFDRATNWAEFREALRKFPVPTQNFVFASVDGTIAYRTGGVLPIRAKGDGLLPVPGWTGEYEWTEFIPFEKMPEVVNPAEGFIVTANNKVIDDKYPYLISHSWAEPYRATRIREMILARKDHRVDDLRLMQVDHTNLQARTLLPILLPLAEKAQGLTSAEKKALELVKAWDQVDTPDKPAPLVFQMWYNHLGNLLFEEKMGKDLFGSMADKGNVTDNMILEAAKGSPSDWMKAAGGLEALAVNSLKKGVAAGAKLQGSNPAKWQWGKYHRIGPAHDIGGAIAPLGWFLNPQVRPVGGSRITVSAMSYRDDGTVRSAGPWRQAVDMANPGGNSFDVVMPGQSGLFLSPWYEDQAALHIEGKLHPQKLLPDAYKKGERLVLKP